MSDKTPFSQLHLPHTCTNKGRVWKWGQTSGGCFPLLSSPVLPPFLSLPAFSFHSCSPANASSLQVELISLQVDWVILCLAVLLGYCFVCLSGNVWHKLSRPCLIPLQWFLRMASRGLLMFPLQHRHFFKRCVFACMCLYVCVWVCAGMSFCLLSQCVPVLSLSRLKWINSCYRKHSKLSRGV